MPNGLTAATGMDALTHAIEAYLSIASTPVTDASALHAMRLINAYLRTAVSNGQDLKVGGPSRRGRDQCPATAPSL